MRYKLTLLLFFCVVFTINAQYAIGKFSIDGSALIDFAFNSKGGIVLPKVSEMPTTAASTQNGTILVNAVNLSSITVQMRQNDSWINLTDPIELTNLDINTITDSKTGFIIGNKTSNAEGALVLESSTKALILPKTTNVTNLTNVTIGTIFYDMNTKSLAIYDGRIWVFWK